MLSIIADDLTGAADAACPFAAQAPLLLLDAAAGSFGDAPVVALDLNCRELPPAAAAAAFAAAASRAGREAPAGLLFAKIDSTLRGPVEAMIGALMAARPGAPVLVCPAFPAQGRLLRQGVVLRHGQPLPEGGDLLARLRAAGLPVLPVPVGTPPRPAAGRVLLLDAETQADLDTALRAALAHHPHCLLSGAAGLAYAAAALLPAPSRAPAALPQGPTLWLLGSATAVLRHQAARLRDALTQPTDAGGRLHPAQWEAIRAALAAGRDAVALLPASTGPLDPDLVARMVAGLPADAAGATNLAMSGGATARAALARLGITRLDLLGEAGPGLPLARARGWARPLGIALKAGGFGDAESLALIQRHLRGANVFGQGTPE